MATNPQVSLLLKSKDLKSYERMMKENTFFQNTYIKFALITISAFKQKSLARFFKDNFSEQSVISFERFWTCLREMEISKNSLLFSNVFYIYQVSSKILLRSSDELWCILTWRVGFVCWKKFVLYKTMRLTENIYTIMKYI